MSKVGDIKKMYGQDFSIIVTNAPAQVINNYTTYSHGPKLLSNILLVSSPMKEGEDIKNPTLFVTDYNGEPLQLTYSVSFGNGLMLNDNGNISIGIDNNTIKTLNGKDLYVNTTALDIIGNNKLGVAKINENIIRTNSEVDNLTFISTDANGTLYLATSFFDWLENYVNAKINDAIRPLINTNLASWIIYYKDNNEGTKYNSAETIPINGGLINSDNITTIKFDFYYKSMSGKPENVKISYDNLQYPILSLPDTLRSNIYDSEKIGDQTIYTHQVKDIEISFYPNLYLNNNTFSSLKYNLQITNQEENQEEPINFFINILQNAQSISGNNLFTIITPNGRIIVNDLINGVNENENYTFTFNNLFYKLFKNNSFNWSNNDITFGIKIKCTCGTNFRDIYNEDNINDKITNQFVSIDIPINDDWISLIVQKNQNGNYDIKNNRYSLNGNSCTYTIELSIKVANTELTYTSVQKIDNDNSTINEVNEKITEANNPDVIIINELSSIDENNENNDRILNYDVVFNDSIYYINIKDISISNISISGISKLINSLYSNNKFNIDYTIHTNNQSAVNKFIINGLKVNPDIGSINGEINGSGIDLGSTEINKDTEKSTTNLVQYETFKIIYSYNTDNRLRLLDNIFQKQFYIEIKSSSFYNDKTMHIQVNDDDLHNYFNDEINDNIIIKQNGTPTPLNIVSEEGDNNKYIVCNTLPNNVDELNISIDPITISDIEYSIFKVTDIELSNDIITIDNDQDNQYKDLSFKIKLNNDNEQLSWEFTMSNYKFRAPKPNSGDDQNNGENGGEEDNTENQENP